MKQKKIVLFTILMLLSLTFTAVASVQAQGPDPLQKRLPAGGISPQALPAAEQGIEDLPSGNGNLLQDPSFELSFGSEAYWEQSSTWFGTPLCTLAVCGNGAGTAGPRTGAVWGWFGGIAPQNETAYLKQSIVQFPVCGAKLQFYLWIGAARSGSDVNDRFTVQIDNTVVFSANATQRSSYLSYKLVTVDVSAFADGIQHNIYFTAQTTGQVVTFNLDDVSLVSGPCITISGNTGVYSNLTWQNLRQQDTWTDANGNYSIQVPLHWSGTVLPDTGDAGTEFSPASRTYSNLTTNQTGQNFTPQFVVTGFVGVPGATMSYMDGTQKMVTANADGGYVVRVPMHWSGTITPSHPCFTFDPVSRSYIDLQGHDHLSSYSPLFNSSAGCANIRVRERSLIRGEFGVPPSSSTRASFGVDSGPMRIESINAISIIGAERLIYKVNGVNTSFSEMMGLPDSELDNVYWLPWYNNVNLDTQLRFANTTNNIATVTITIGSTVMPSISLSPGRSTRISYPNIDSGPVKIESDQNLVASERIIYKANGVNTSFSEMMALPEKQLDTTYWLPWYNNVNLDSQLRFANVSANPATVTITIGGVPQAPINLTAGESTRISYPGVDAGPVKIESTQPIVASERVIYKVNNIFTSFSEMMALPNNKLGSTYHLPWYNNLTLDTQLRIANVSNNPATITVTIGGVAQTPINLAAGESTRVSYVGIDSGPVKITSTQNIVAAERVIYKVNNVNTSFSEMMALPNSLLGTLYWFPWYNNVGLDTQLRFGVP